MADDLERVLRALEEAKEFARTYRFEMTDEYRAVIERVEAMPRNHLVGAARQGSVTGPVGSRLVVGGWWLMLPSC